ncbi:MAG: hypothetical protein ACKVZ6_03740 [Kineosporiaceae bacterium]
MDRPAQRDPGVAAPPRGAVLAALLAWLMAAACFGFVYWRLDRAAAAWPTPCSIPPS